MVFNPDSPEANVPKKKESKLQKSECNLHGWLFFVRYKGQLVCPLCMAEKGEKDFLQEFPRRPQQAVDFKELQLPRKDRSDAA